MDDNDFEVEASTPLLSTEQQIDDTPQIDLQLKEGTSPPSPRKRFIQIGLVVVAFVVAVVVLGVPLATKQAPGVSVTTPQPTSPASTVLLTSNINFGKVTINGRPQRGATPLYFPVQTTGSNPAYQIVIDAPPFSEVTCTLSFINSAPAAGGSSNCVLGIGGYPVNNADGTTTTPDYVIDVHFTDDDLPTDQQDQINTVLLQSFTFQHTMTVPIGSYIVTSFNADNTITSQLAAEALQATASLNVSRNLSLMILPCSGLICNTGITFDTSFAITASKVWLVDTPTALSWQFTTAAGRMLANVAFPVSTLSLVVLLYTPNVGWSLAPASISTLYTAPSALGGPDCTTGFLILQQMLQTSEIDSSSEGGQEAAGCKITVQDDSGGEENFLWRFGVLMAIDKAAHQALPNLPIAPQAEIDAVAG